MQQALTLFSTARYREALPNNQYTRGNKMTEGIIIAIITAGLSLVGVIYSNRKTEKTVKGQTDLTIYRIEQLEKKQDIHNNLIDRMYKAEEDITLLKEQYKVGKHRIQDLEAFHKPPR